MSSDEITKYINTHVENIVDNKIKAFEKSLKKNYSFEKTYELKNPILRKHIFIIAIEQFNKKLTQKNKNFRVDFDEDTRKHFIRIHHDYFKKDGYISDDKKINSLKLFKEKCELNQVIKDYTDDDNLKMIPIVIYKYFEYPLYETTVR